MQAFARIQITPQAPAEALLAHSLGAEQVTTNTVVWTTQDNCARFVILLGRWNRERTSEGKGGNPNRAWSQVDHGPMSACWYRPTHRGDTQPPGVTRQLRAVSATSL